MNNLAEVPAEILAADPNAKTLWCVFLKKIGIHFDKQGDAIENETHRAEIIRKFGVPSLLQRLPFTKTEVERARVWWRESMACDAGESIPDLGSENMYVLNPFIVTKSLKFRNPRFEQLAMRKKEQEQMQQVEIASGIRHCGNRAIGRHPLPSDVRSNAKFCDRACRQAAYRGRKVA